MQYGAQKTDRVIAPPRRPGGPAFLNPVHHLAEREKAGEAEHEAKPIDVKSLLP